MIDPGLWVRRRSPWGQAGIAALVRIARIGTVFGELWLIFLASCKPTVNKLLRSFVLLSLSLRSSVKLREGSGLRKGLEILRSTAFRSDLSLSEAK